MKCRGGKIIIGITVAPRLPPFVIFSEIFFRIRAKLLFLFTSLQALLASGVFIFTLYIVYCHSYTVIPGMGLPFR